MGWTGNHLHRFRTGAECRSPYSGTGFDLDEGEDGLLEHDVFEDDVFEDDCSRRGARGRRALDQLAAAKGDRLWYEADCR